MQTSDTLSKGEGFNIFLEVIGEIKCLGLSKVQKKISPRSAESAVPTLGRYDVADAQS